MKNMAKSKGAIEKGTEDKEVLKGRLSKRMVIVVHGNIIDQAAEIIVNSIGNNIKSGFGGIIAGHILKGAGNEIIDEAVKEALLVKNKDSLDVGEFISTKSGKSEKQKYFIHCVCPSWGSAKCEEVLKNLIKDILVFWDKNKIESISFPPMSSGNLGFPTKNCANAFFNGIMEFLDEDGRDCNTWLKKLNVCIIEKDKHQEFQDKWIECFKNKYGDDMPGSDEDEASEVDEASGSEEEKVPVK